MEISACLHTWGYRVYLNNSTQGPMFFDWARAYFFRKRAYSQLTGFKDRKIHVCKNMQPLACMQLHFPANMHTHVLMYCFSPFNISLVFLGPFCNSRATDFFKSHLLIHKPTVPWHQICCYRVQVLFLVQLGTYLNLPQSLCMSPERLPRSLWSKPSSFTSE